AEAARRQGQDREKELTAQFAKAHRAFGEVQEKVGRLEAEIAGLRKRAGKAGELNGKESELKAQMAKLEAGSKELAERETALAGARNRIQDRADPRKDPARIRDPPGECAREELRDGADDVREGDRARGSRICGSEGERRPRIPRETPREITGRPGLHGEDPPAERGGSSPPGERGPEGGDGERRGGEGPRGTHAGTHSTRPTRGSEIDLRAGTLHAARTGAEGARGGLDETETGTQFSIDHPRGSGTEPSRSERRTRGAPKRSRTPGTANPESRPGKWSGGRRSEVPRGGARRAGGRHQGERGDSSIARE